MGLLNWFINKSSAEQRQHKFCSTQFPQLWSSYIDHFVDVGFSGASCASPVQAGVTTELPTVLPAAERLVAIGDLHGDLGKAKRAFRAAGLTDDRDHWVGGSTVAVQVGDVLDRGDQELRILLFLESLQAQARAAGGALHVINGNHETMNVMGNHRYATQGATHEIVRWNHWQQLASRLKSQCNCSNGYDSETLVNHQPSSSLQAAQDKGMYGASHFIRTFALQPGSQITKRFFANHPTILQVGSTVFVHGGVLPHHVQYGIENINKETQAWMRAETAAAAPTSETSPPAAGARDGSTHQPLPAPSFLKSSTAVVWARDYSAEDANRCDCDKLEQVLKGIPGAQRMVMGHTIQQSGINAVCGGKALRVDVGMSKGCGDGEVEVLEIRQDGAQVLRVQEGKAPQDVTSQIMHEAERVTQPAAVKGWPAFVMPSPTAV